MKNESGQERKERNGLAVSFIRAAIEYLELPDKEAYDAFEAANVEPNAPIADVVRSTAIMEFYQNRVLATTQAVAQAIRADRVSLSLFLPVIQGGALVSLPYHIAQAIVDAVDLDIYRLSKEDTARLEGQWSELNIMKRQCEIYQEMFKNLGFDKPRF